MKFFYYTIAVLLLSTSTGFAKGSGGGMGMGGGMGGGQIHSNMQASGEQDRKMGSLRAFLALSDEQLLRLEETIRELRQMSPEERRALQEKVDAYYQLPVVKRESLARDWMDMDYSVKRTWQDYVGGLTDAEREALRERMQAADPTERTAIRMEILRREGLLEE